MNFMALHDIYLPVTNLEFSTDWFKDHFDMVVETLPDDSYIQNATRLSFRQTSFILVETSHLNRYSHIPFNFHTNQIRNIHSILKEKGITVTDVVEDDDMLCCDFYDPDGNRIGLVNDSSSYLADSEIEVGGTFLNVRRLNEAVNWYQDKLGYNFHYFEATGKAGYAGPTPDYVPDLTIKYAGVNKDSFQNKWSRVALVETPEFRQLVHPPYSIRSFRIREDYERLKEKGVEVTSLKEFSNKKQFSFLDLDGNEIEVLQID